MVTQSSSKCKTRTRRVDPWRQQHSRINLTNYVFELIVRTPKKSFENISKSEKMSTRGLPGGVSVDTSLVIITRAACVIGIPGGFCGIRPRGPGRYSDRTRTDRRSAGRPPH